MPRLYSEKMVNVIADAQLESHLIKLVERHVISGYTLLEARGRGANGLQTGSLDIDSNILFMMIVSVAKLDAVLTDLEKLMQQGHHLVIFVSEVGVLRPHKFI